MARPEYCPVLSSTPVFDENSGTLKSSMLVKCKGEACALYREKDDSCALGVVEPVAIEPDRLPRRGTVRVADGAHFDHETEPTIDVELTATDHGGLSIIETFTITVGDVNRPPVLATISTPKSVDEGNTLTFTATATDPSASSVRAAASAAGTTATGRSSVSSNKPLAIRRFLRSSRPSIARQPTLQSCLR